MDWTPLGLFLFPACQSGLRLNELGKGAALHQTSNSCYQPKTRALVHCLQFPAWSLGCVQCCCLDIMTAATIRGAVRLKGWCFALLLCAGCTVPCMHSHFGGSGASVFLYAEMLACLCCQPVCANIGPGNQSATFSWPSAVRYMVLKWQRSRAGGWGWWFDEVRNAKGCCTAGSL